jgi:hypothetical protein
VPLSEHLEKASAEVRAIYDVVIEHLRGCGPLDTVPTKSGINLLSGTSLGGIELQKSKARVGFVLTRRLSDPRIGKTLQISRRRIVHYVDLESVEDVDHDVRAWLTEAHGVGMLAGKRC